MFYRALILLASLMLSFHAPAQTSATKPLRIIVPFPPGGGTDVVARAVAPRMSEVLGVPVIILNQAGAGGSTGTEMAARAPADGNTVLLVSSSTAINHTFDKNISWNLLKDFDPVVLMLFNQSMLVVNPSVPVNSVQDLIALAKKDPKRLTYGSSGPGSSAHLSMELFKMMAGVEMLHVPYKGAAPAMNDLIGGQVDAMLIDISVILPQVQAGKLKAIGLGSPQRFAATPNVPTIAESGVPGFEVTGLIGLIAPAGTPAASIQRINAAANEAIKDPEVRKRLISMAMIMEGGPPERLGEVLQREVKKWATVINTANLKN